MTRLENLATATALGVIALCCLLQLAISFAAHRRANAAHRRNTAYQARAAELMGQVADVQHRAIDVIERQADAPLEGDEWKRDRDDVDDEPGRSR